ncbi:MAG: Ig-like domain-containing protein, partial [bacterium]|nr:Ig-like domain-containing protein [bacterium]
MHLVKKFFWFIGAALMMGVGLPAFAQVDTGSSFISDTIGLSSGDPRIIAAKIIQLFLGFVAIVVLGLILYGGYAWMTSQGDEEKVEEAKKILTNAVIGLVIIIASVAITQFIIRSLVGDTGVFNGGPGGGGDGGPGGGRLGVNTLLVRSISPPEGTSAVRNTVIRVELNQPVDPTTFTADDIRVTDVTGGQNVPVAVTATVSAKSQNRIEVRSNSNCEAPNQQRFCFAGNRQLTVQVSERSFASRNGQILSCANNNCIRHFATNNLVDTADPVVSITSPQNGAFVPQGIVAVSVRATDDTGIAGVDVLVDGSLVATAVVPPFEVAWDAANAPLRSSHTITAEALDRADNTTTSAPVRVNVRAAHCYD